MSNSNNNKKVAPLNTLHVVVISPKSIYMSALFHNCIDNDETSPYCLENNAVDVQIQHAVMRGYEEGIISTTFNPSHVDDDGTRMMVESYPTVSHPQLLLHTPSVFPMGLPTTTTILSVTGRSLWEVGDHFIADDRIYGSGDAQTNAPDVSFDSVQSAAGDLDSSVGRSADILPPTVPTPDRHHRLRERDVSSMGSSSSAGRSRSGLRLAKKERRQKAKDGQEGVEAFAGDDLGESCEDEGMTEIVVVSPKHPYIDKSDSNWASNMLEPPSALIKPQTSTSIEESVGIVETTTTTTTTAPMMRTDLRRGKRALMRSWLDTPALGVTEADLPSDGAINITNSSPLPIPSDGPALGLSEKPTPNDPAITTSSDTNLPIVPIVINTSHIFSLGSQDLHKSREMLSPSYSNASEPSISLSGVQVSIGNHHCSPMTSMSLDELPSPSALDDAVSPTSSSISVRHSRPRDTIRSIQALRALSLSSNTVDALTPTSAIRHPTLLRRRPQPPVSFMSCSTSFPYFSRLSHRESDSKVMGSETDLKMDDSNVSPGVSIDVTPVSGGLTDELPADPTCASASSSQTNVSLQLCLHPGPKPRNVVTFNADAYNLDAWDADVMGLFALPTEGVTGLVSKRDTSSMRRADMSASCGGDTTNPLVASWSSHPGGMLSPKADDSPRTSFSVLTEYFDQSRSNTAWGLDSAARRQQHDYDAEFRDQILSNGDLDFDECDSLSRGDIYCQTIVHPTTSSAVQYVVSPRDEGMLSANTSRTSSTANTTILYHEHLKDYLLQVAVAHAKTTAQSILVDVTKYELERQQQHQQLTPHINAEYDDDVSRGFKSIPVYEGANTESQSQSGDLERSILNAADTTPRGAHIVKHKSMNKTQAFSDIISKFVTLDTLVHQATSYTEQLANPVSDAGQIKRGSQDRWETADVCN